MIEELEAYAKESKVDDLFRDMMTGCFKKRPSAPVTYILEYLASEYPEESLTHARAFVDLKDGITSANVAVDEDEDGAHDVVVEDIDEKHEIVEAPLTSPKDVPAKATDVVAEAKTLSAKEPVGAIDGESAVAYGAGAVMTETEEKELAAIDPDQMVKLDAYSAAPAR